MGGKKKKEKSPNSKNRDNDPKLCDLKLACFLCLLHKNKIETAENENATNETSYY